MKHVVPIAALGLIARGFLGPAGAEDPDRYIERREVVYRHAVNVSGRAVRICGRNGTGCTVVEPGKEFDLGTGEGVSLGGSYTCGGTTGEGNGEPCDRFMKTVRTKALMVTSRTTQPLICRSKSGKAVCLDGVSVEKIVFDLDPRSPEAFASCSPAPEGAPECADCYITTAVCRYTGKGDGCDELDTLRRYRDEVLAATSEGRRDIARYYGTAPRIVAAIDRQEDPRAIYEGIRRNFILPSVSAVAEGRYDEAYRIYRAMTETLEDRYLRRETAR